MQGIHTCANRKIIMQINAKTRLQAAPVTDIAQEVKGKKLDFKAMKKFLASKKDLFEQRHPNSDAFSVKKGVKLNLAGIVSALNKAAVDGATVYKTPGILMLDWDWSVPVPGKVLFDSTEDKAQVKTNWEKTRELATGTGGGKGWYVDITLQAGRNVVFGTFTDGPLEGNTFATVDRSGKQRKKGEAVKVKVTNVEQGKTELAN